MHTLTLEVKGINYLVQGTYYQAQKGGCIRGIPLEPDEPVSFEINSIHDEGGREADVCEDILSALIDKSIYVIHNFEVGAGGLIWNP